MSDFDPYAEQRLLQAIVTQALIDATSEPVLNTKPINRKAKDDDIKHAKRVRALTTARLSAFNADMKDRAEARRWLLLDEASFPNITTLAGYNPDDIRERSQKLAQAGWKRPATVPDYALAA